MTFNFKESLLDKNHTNAPIPITSKMMIAKIFGSTNNLSAISIAIGEKRTAQALFDIKLVVIDTKI